MTGHKNRIKLIEGLRGLAIIAVLIYHLDNNFLKSGFLGVDVFFCISGFVVAYSLSARSDERLFEHAKNFYKRRAIRLLPALVVYLSILRVFESLFVPSSWLSENNQTTAKWSFFSLANVYLSNDNDGYFSERVDFNPFVHLWSLSTENQFYLIFPIVLWVGSYYFKKKLLLVMFTLTSLLGLVALNYSSNPTASYYSPFSRFWQIFAGVVAYLIWSRFAKSMNYSYARDILFSIGIFGLIFLFTKNTQPDDLFYLQAMATFLTFLILVATPKSENLKPLKFEFLLQFKLVRYLGLISYSLYLWHWGIFVLFRWTIGLDTIYQKVFAVVIAITFAQISYSLIEVKFSDYMNVKKREKVLKPVLIKIVVTVLLSLNVLPINLTSLSLSKSNDPQTWELKERDKLPIVIDDSQGDLKVRKLLIIGDSHAGAYSLLAKLSELELGIQTQIISLSGCPIFTFIGDSLENPICKNFMEDVTKVAIDNTQDGDIVFFASLRMPRLGNQWGLFDLNEIIEGQNSLEKINNRKRELELAINSISKLNLSNRIVLIDLPKPVFPAPIFRCLDWFNRGNDICEGGLRFERAILQELAFPTKQAIGQLQTQTKLEVWDPFPTLCPDEVCSVKTKNDSILFFDGDHLSNAGNQILKASFLEKIREIWGENRG